MSQSHPGWAPCWRDISPGELGNMEYIYCTLMYIPTPPLVRQKQVFSRIQAPATELHVVYFSSGSRTQPNWLLSWPQDVSTLFSWNHLKQSYSSSYFLPTGGSKTWSCFKRNFIGFYWHFTGNFSCWTIINTLIFENWSPCKYTHKPSI